MDVIHRCECGFPPGSGRASQVTGRGLQGRTVRIRRDKAGDGVARKFLHKIERVWRPALLAGQATEFRFHDLRHTFAGRLAMAGVDLHTV